MCESTCAQVLSILGKELGLKRLTINFLQLLIVESRIDALQAVLESFETLYNQAINLQAGPTPLPGAVHDINLLGCSQCCMLCHA